ncbi:MAG: 2OG-Fe(II) oxygenase [Sphingomicrobium sp.]
MSIEAAVQTALSRRDVGEAHRLLAEAGDKGDAAAAFELGRWFLSGQIVPRDLTVSRNWFGKAASLGHPRSQLIHAALLGNGIGGVRDWQSALGELRRASAQTPQAAEELRLLDLMAIDDQGNPGSLPASEAVSESPTIYWARALFSAAECDALVSFAAPLLNASVVVDPATGQMRADPIRTSEAAMFPWIDETPFIHALNRRIAAASGTMVEQGEPLQVLRYSPGQEYRSHSDALAGAENQRIMTALVYLNEDFEGGETEFPAPGLKLRGGVGDALFFRNVDRNGQADARATHAGLPITDGQKWLASRWIRERPFGR